MKLVDVLVFTNNHKNFLYRCLVSIKNQSYKKINVLLFDNNRSKTISEKILALVNEYHHCPKIRGPSNLRNYGISKAKNEFIAFIDGDDFWDKNKIQMQLNKILNNEDSLIYTRIYSHFNGKNILDNRKLYSGNLFKKLIYKEVSITGSMSGIMIKKKMLRKLKQKYGTYFNKNLDYCEDYDFFIKISTLYNFIYIDKPLVYINIYETSHQSKFDNYQRTNIKYKMIIDNLKLHKKEITKLLMLLITIKAKLKIFIKYFFSKKITKY